MDQHLLTALLQAIPPVITGILAVVGAFKAHRAEQASRETKRTVVHLINEVKNSG